MDCKIGISTDLQTDECDSGPLGTEVLAKDAIKYVCLLAPNNKLFVLSSFHRAFRRITLIVNQQMHLHKITD